MILFDRALNWNLGDHIHWPEKICLSTCFIFHIYIMGKMLLTWFLKQFQHLILNNSIYEICIVYHLLNKKIQSQSDILCLETIWSKDLQASSRENSRFMAFKRHWQNVVCLNGAISRNRDRNNAHDKTKRGLGLCTWVAFGLFSVHTRSAPLYKSHLTSIQLLEVLTVD